MLRTRPGLAPPQICLPSTLSDTGHTCTSTHAFASGFLQVGIAATASRGKLGISDLPSATLRLRQAGSGLCPISVSQYQTSPLSSRAKPGTQRMFAADVTRRSYVALGNTAETSVRHSRSACPLIGLRDVPIEFHRLISQSVRFCRLAGCIVVYYSENVRIKTTLKEYL